MDTKAPLRFVESSRTRFVAELSELVKIPSCSFPGHPAAEVERSGKAVAAYLKGVGLQKVQVLRLPGVHPYVYGEWLGAKGAPTLLLYAHHDVQPVGREKLWKSPPYKPTVRNGRLYGRGTADDKAGIVVHGAAIEAWLKTTGKLPLNVKVLIEGEEEIGSENLPRMLRKYRKLLSADAMVLTDTGNHDTGLPSVTTSLRGIVAVDVTVRTADHPLHSGMWGGPLPDPVIALSKMLATLTDEQGRLAIPALWKDVRKPNPTEARSYASLRYSEGEFRKQAQVLPGVSLVGGKSSPILKMWREPAVSVNAIQASSRQSVANIINESAWAHVGVRIVPDMDPAKTARLVQAHLKKAAPWGVKVEFSKPALARWWITNPEHPAFAAAKRALTEGYGREAVYVGSGGSIGFVEPFSEELGGVPALLIGVEDPYTNPHSENESLHLGDFHKSIRSSVLLYEELSKVLR
ncbi:MAG: M20/M25/M40 family metallo-hydrolase [Elusimicrobia bacterium]|nr:M20/M25/M40 family metallo-hydrolase [Elusimicrobiota bacterium]